MIYEAIFWGGPKDGYIERSIEPPIDNIYCLNHFSPLLNEDQVEIDREKNQVGTMQYSRYTLEKITKRKFKYTFNGLK